MRFSLTVLFLLALAVVLAAPPLAADVDVSVEITFSTFHERLAPHGEWIEVDNHGWCWYPSVVVEDWRPYSDGHWVYSDFDGWIWVDDHDWGWACSHYGRWTYHGTRWVWVPGYEWSGAWVAWRHGGTYVGWAALPPTAHWDVEVGIRTTGFSYETDISHSTWVFVAEAHITSPSIKTVILRSGRNEVILRETKVLGSVKVEKGRAANKGLDVKVAERATGKPVKKVKITATKTLGAAQIKGGDDEVRVFKPKVKKGDAGSPKNVDKTRGKRKTVEEKHDAEKEDLNGRHEREAKDKPDDNGRKERQEKERKAIEDRQKREREDIEKGSPGKSDDPKRDDPKRDDPKRDDPKRDDPKRDDPKRDDPKRDDPKRDDPKKDDPKRDDPKRDDPKKDDPKKDDPKKDDPKKKDPKKDEE